MNNSTQQLWFHTYLLLPGQSRCGSCCDNQSSPYNLVVGCSTPTTQASYYSEVLFDLVHPSCMLRSSSSTSSTRWKFILVGLSSGILMTYPAYRSLPMVGSPSSACSSWFMRLRHAPSAFCTPPKIVRSIFRSKTPSAC